MCKTSGSARWSWQSLYVPKVRSEEHFLAGKFPGQWPQYAASTPRFLPRLTVWPSLSGWRLSQWMKSREYNAVAATLGGHRRAEGPARDAFLVLAAPPVRGRRHFPCRQAAGWSPEAAFPKPPWNTRRSGPRHCRACSARHRAAGRRSFSCGSCLDQPPADQFGQGVPHFEIDRATQLTLEKCLDPAIELLGGEARREPRRAAERNRRAALRGFPVPRPRQSAASARRHCCPDSCNTGFRSG